MDQAMAAKIITMFLRRFGNILKSEEKTEAFLAQRMEEGDPPFSEKLIQDKNAHIAPLADGQMVVFGNEAAPRAVLYMHGGAYATQANSAHVNFCDKLVRRTGRCVYMPLYPLLPHHHCQESFAMADALWEKIKGKPAVFMGDSSGAGFILSYAQMLRDRGDVLPEQIFSFSPCPDASMTACDHSFYEAQDSLVGVPGVVVVGKAWANGLDIRDPRISPLYGDCRGLPPTTLFAGSTEVVYPDAVLFLQKLQADGVDAELIVGEGVGHIFPLRPFPEADDAFERIVQKMERA